MTSEFNFTNGPMTTQRAMNNLLAALNIAQGKGSFNLRESAFVYSSLQTLNEFVKKHDKSENNDVVIKDPEPITKPNPIEKKIEKSIQKPVLKKPVEKKTLPDINLENDEPISEIIEI